jgi:hypothetical protein
METNSMIIIGIVILVAILAITFKKSPKDLTVTIKMEEDYPVKDDGVEELEVKPKRAYKKRAPKSNVAKRPVGRPKKIK